MQELIFVVEDDSGIQDLYECAFASSGFLFESFYTAEDMLERIKSVLPDLIVLDIMLPKLDGIETLKILKQNPKTANIPVILVSAKSEEATKVKGLVGGADDYVTKPFGVMELIARINNCLKRNTTAQQKENIVYKNIVVDTKKHCIFIDDNFVDLTRKEYELAKILFSSIGEVQTRDFLFDSVWGDNFYESRTLDIHINTLRKKLLQFCKDELIETVRGVGYVVGDRKIKEK